MQKRRQRLLRWILTHLPLVLVLLWPTFALASAGRPLPPSGIHAISPVPTVPGPELAGPLQPDTLIYNHLVEAEQRAAADLTAPPMVSSSAGVEGPGILAAAHRLGRGGVLFQTTTACLTFDDPARWNGHVSYASYGNWGTFAVDDGGFYRPDHVRFEMEETVGAGYSFKIAGDRPYAAGLVSPAIQAPPGAAVDVRIKYLMFNHDGIQVGGRVVNDWVSVGLKADAQGAEARYVNGYTRGQWSEMANSVVAGESGQVLILLQAESPAAFNSNIYFDDLEIWIDGRAVVSCE